MKDRVINLEQELQETQRKAGLPIILPYDSASLKLTPQMSRKQPPTTDFLIKKYDAEISDTEISDLSPDCEDGKTATVERKIPLKDELDTAIPQHELLDNSVNKSKSNLAARSKVNRQLPTEKKKSHSNSGSDCALDESDDDHTDESSLNNGLYSTPNNVIKQKKKSNLIMSQDSPPLYAQVHKERNDHNQTVISHSTIPNMYRNQADVTTKINVNSSCGSDLNTSYDSDLGSSTDKLDDSAINSDNWMYPSRRPKGLKGITPPSLAEQLKDRLAEREGRRLAEDGSSRDSSDDYTELNRTQSPAATLSNNLLVEIKKAVNEAKGN